MKELIVDYLLTETENEVEVTMNAMNDLVSTASPEVKPLLQAVISAKVRLVRKEINRLIAEADRIIEEENLRE